MSSFSAISTALSGLLAHQTALEVTGHNVSNVSTPGYHRQEVEFQTRVPYPPAGNPLASAGGQFGTGVDVASIRRVQNDFLQQQMRLVVGQMGRWNVAHDALGQIENFLAPGQNLDLSSMLDRFFGAWQQLATHPEDLASRQTVRSEAINLTNTFNQLAEKLDYMSAQVDANISTRVDRINLLADKLATLNGQIGMAKAEGRSPNDLQDQRDVVLSELTALAGVLTLSTDEASGITSIAGHALVQGISINKLVAQDTPSGMVVTWADDGTAADIRSGEIAGLYEVRNVVIPEYKRQLDSMAFALAGAVNGLHQTGVTMSDAPAGEFFVGDSAGGIRVSDAILADAREIAATTTPGAPGDGGLASGIYALYNSPLIGNQTLNQSAQSLIGQIGNAVRTAGTSLEASTALQEQLFQQQQATSGVSLDEEMANLLVFQRAYDASARVLRTADEMLETIIERMG